MTKGRSVDQFPSKQLRHSLASIPWSSIRRVSKDRTRKEVIRNFNSQFPPENKTISSPLRGRIKVGVIPLLQREGKRAFGRKLATEKGPHSN